MAVQEYGIVLVPSTREAIEGERLAKKAGLSVRFFPTPGQIDASRGVSLNYELNDEAALTALFDKEAVEWAALYHACRQGLSVSYTKIKEG